MQDDGHFGQDGRPTALRPIRFWSMAKGSTWAVLEGEDLAVDGGPLGQGVSHRGELGVALGDQLFSPRPEEGVVRPRRMSWQRMPSHFHSACQRAMSPSDSGASSRG